MIECKKEKRADGTDHITQLQTDINFPVNYNNALTAKHPPPSSVSKTKMKKKIRHRPNAFSTDTQHDLRKRKQGRNDVGTKERYRKRSKKTRAGCLLLNNCMGNARTMVGN